MQQTNSCTSFTIVSGFTCAKVLLVLFVMLNKTTVGGVLYPCITGPVRRIHSCDCPVGDADGQQDKGDDWIEERRHDVTYSP